MEDRTPPNVFRGLKRETVTFKLSFCGRLGFPETFTIFINKIAISITYYYIPGRMLSPLYLLPHLIFIILPILQKKLKPREGR